MSEPHDAPAADLPPVEEAADRPLPARGFRWWPVPAILMLSLAAVWVVDARFGSEVDGDATQLVFATLGVAAGTLLALLVWWVGFSRLGWAVKGAGLGVFAAVGVAFVACVRIEQVDGAMRPTKWSFRWEPSAEERALAELADREAAAPGEWSPPEELAPTDWPRFRGFGGEGVVPADSVALDWEANPPEPLWRQPCGLGWSSFAVVAGRAFTQEQRGEEELVVAYDAATGGQIWTYAVRDRFSEPVGGDGPRATPTYAGGTLYAVGATGNLSALDPADGAVVWERNILEDAGGGESLDNNPWAVAASPFVTDGKLYLPAGGNVAGAVLCYDAKTGEPLWTAGENPASYATFAAATFDGTEQLLVFDGLGLNGLDPADGTNLWSVGFTNQPRVNAIVPVVRGDRIFVSSGYGVGSGLYEIARDGDRWKADAVWRTENKFKLKFNDPVVTGGHVYGLDEGILACVDLETGKRKWKRGRYGYGQLLLVGDRIVVLDEEGVVRLVEANPEKFVELAEFTAIEGKTWNHPAIADGLLLVRNSEEAACYDLRPTPPAVASNE